MTSDTADTTILANLIADRMQRWPDRDVLTFVSINADGGFDDEIRTYADLWRNGQRVAAGLDAEGLQIGETFGVITQNHPEFVDVMVGSSIAGTVFVPIDPRTKGKKLAFMLEHAQCRGVVIGDYALPQLIEVVDQCPSLQWVWVLGDTGAGDAIDLRARGVADVLATACDDSGVRVSDPAAPMQMLYTSGTTGDPKAIRSSYSRFGMIGGLGEALGLHDDDRPYTGLSLTHANAQLITLGTTLHMGLRGVFSRKFTKSRLWDVTRQYGCTVFNLLGGMTTAIYSEPQKDNDADNPVRYVLSAGMPAAIWEKFEKRYNLKVYEFYGAAEGGLTLNPPGSGGPVGSIGKPPPTLEGRIVDADGNDCAPGEPGEIIFRNADGTSPVVSYYRDPDASRKKTEDGWLRMGDVGYRDADGWYYFLYRKGGGIRHNGDFINPAFVEKELAENPAINDVFVYGVTSANGVPGEKDVIAAIVPTDAANFDPKLIFAACRKNLESNFIPTYLQIVSEIPKTASEKPQERFLLEAFDLGADNVFTE